VKGLSERVALLRFAKEKYSYYLCVNIYTIKGKLISYRVPIEIVSSGKILI